MLLDKGADMHAMDMYAGTVLSYAAGEGTLDMVKLFLDHGADVDQVGYLENWKGAKKKAEKGKKKKKS